MKILSSKQYGVNLKATVQSTGKLGFSGPTATALDLSAGGFIRFGQDDDADETLYLAVMNGVDEDGFKIMQSGGYYSVNTKTLFETLNVDYKSQTVIYDLQRDSSKDDDMGGQAYRMTPRILPKKQSEASERCTNDNNGSGNESDAGNSENIEDV